MTEAEAVSIIRDQVIGESKRVRDRHMRLARFFGSLRMSRRRAYHIAFARGMNKHVVMQVRTGRNFGERR